MYRNWRTKGSSVRGFDALSPRIGREIWNQITFHDDGKIGYGGTRTQIIGGGGGGKTTLSPKFALQSFNINNISKKDFTTVINDFIESQNKTEQELDIIRPLVKECGQNIRQETILWRGREFDIWNVLTENNVKKYFPTDMNKPLRVHIYKHSGLQFFETNPEKNERWEMKDLDIKKYVNMGELVGNLIEGGNNIIYPPLKHYLSPRLKEVINTKRTATADKNRRGQYSDRHYLAPETNYLAERDIFLFEIFEYLFRMNSDSNTRKFYTAIIDESHDLFRANAPDIYYWIIEYMTDNIIEMRKLNLSLVCMTHALNLIDYRILERISHFLWLPGSKPIPKYSKVDQSLIRKISTGKCVLESIMSGEIGRMMFNRIPKELPVLSVEGMTERKSLSTLVADEEFEAITEES